MKEHELTDAEFIEVLEAHKKGFCRNCPIGKNEDLFLNKPCSKIIPETAIRIFNKQKAEIEKLEAGRREDAKVIQHLNRELFRRSEQREDKEHKFRCETCRHRNKDRDDDHPCRECVDHQYWE